MKILSLLGALLLTLGTPLTAGKPGSWQVEPPGEGSAETYVYATDHGRFLAGAKGSGIWVIYGPRAPRPDGSCTFDSCTVNVTLNGKEGYDQEWVRFAFSDGSTAMARPNIKGGGYNVVSDRARVNWPTVSVIMAGLRRADWVEISFADGTKKRFSLAGSSAAFKRGAASARP